MVRFVGPRVVAAGVALGLMAAPGAYRGGGGLPAPWGLARAAQADAYLVQIQYALAKLEHQMAKLTQRASTLEPLARCSFGKKRREYYIAREELQAKMAEARRSPGAAVRKRKQVEAAFEGVRRAFERALACYR